MSAKVLDLTGKLQALPVSGESVREVLVRLLADMDAGKPVQKIALVMLVDDQDRPGDVSYDVRTNSDTLFETHTLLCVGARMQMDIMVGADG